MAVFPRVPGYELKKFLGSGGAADVFLAVDRSRSRLVAVKVLARRRFAETVAVRRFIKEAQSISSLHHPNIVRVFATGRTPELRFMAMEFFPESLKRRIQERGRLAPDEALTIASQIASALYYAHDRGFVHRDVKPDNIMFRPAGTPVLLDFGIARVIESTTQLTRSGMAMGTPRYMSPEQLNAKRADGRSDVYSLGVVLYEMLSGAPPFKGSQTMAVLLKHVAEPVPPLPADLARFQPLFERLLAKERGKRPGNEKEWRELVKPYFRPFRLPKAGKPEFGPLPRADAGEKTRQGGAAATASRRDSGTRPKRRQQRSRRLFLLNLLLVLALAAWLFFNYERLPEMIASLARSVASGISSLLAKI